MIWRMSCQSRLNGQEAQNYIKDKITLYIECIYSVYTHYFYRRCKITNVLQIRPVCPIGHPLGVGFGGGRIAYF